MIPAFKGALRSKARASLPLDAMRDTPIWKLEAALKCRSCKEGRYAPPVHMIKLTATQEITPQPEPVSRDQLPKPPVNEFFFIELGVGERLQPPITIWIRWLFDQR